jgi:hypothetical protein
LAPVENFGLQLLREEVSHDVTIERRTEVSR